MSHSPEPQTIVDCKDATESVGLSYASTDEPGIIRRRAGKGFSYRGPDAKVINDKAALARILAIPPAWENVWICADPNGHIQAAGYDVRGRKQYRYHAKFGEIREDVKYEHMIAFADALPSLRQNVGARHGPQQNPCNSRQPA